MNCKHVLVVNGRETDHRMYPLGSASMLTFIGMKMKVARWMTATYEGESLRVEIHYGGGAYDVERYTPGNEKERLALAWLATFIVNFQLISKWFFSGLLKRHMIDEETAEKAAQIAQTPWLRPQQFSEAGIQPCVLALALLVRADHDQVWPKYQQLLEAIGNNPMILQPVGV